MTTVNFNSDFIFLYDATLCNPNGDPDQENKPRMDYDTSTNLVTDTRIKRFIRDYLKNQGQDIFVDMEGERKVSMDTRLLNIISLLFDSGEFEKRLLMFQDVKASWEKLKEQVNINAATNSNYYSELMKIYKAKKKADVEEQYKELKKTVDELFPKFNDAFLFALVQNDYIDLRMFGSAVAVSGFPRTATGAIQLNWGYSLNQVELVESSSIVTIMNDDSSTFGKDYRVYYSLLAFNGTINKYAAKTTGLTEDDQKLFRKAIWESIPSQPTRSKMNQYPKLYLEIVYNEGFNNGYFGDLRNTIKVDYKAGVPAKQVRSFNDLAIDVSILAKLINENKGEGKPIKEVIISKSIDFPELKIN